MINDLSLPARCSKIASIKISRRHCNSKYPPPIRPRAFHRSAASFRPENGNWGEGGKEMRKVVGTWKKKEKKSTQNVCSQTVSTVWDEREQKGKKEEDGIDY